MSKPPPSLDFPYHPSMKQRTEINFFNQHISKASMAIGFWYVVVEKANFYENSVLHCIFVSKHFSQIVIRNIVPKVNLSNLPALPYFSSWLKNVSKYWNSGRVLAADSLSLCTETVRGLTLLFTTCEHRETAYWVAKLKQLRSSLAMILSLLLYISFSRPFIIKAVSYTHLTLPTSVYV